MEIIQIIIVALMTQTSGLYAGKNDKCDPYPDLNKFYYEFAKYTGTANGYPNKTNGLVKEFIKKLKPIYNSCTSNETRTIIDNAKKGAKDIGTQSQQTNKGADMTLERFKSFAEYALTLIENCEEICDPLKKFLRITTESIEDTLKCQTAAYGTLISQLKESTRELNNISQENAGVLIQRSSMRMKAIGLCGADYFEICKIEALRKVCQALNELRYAFECCYNKRKTKNV